MQQTKDQSFQNLIQQSQRPQQQESNASERRIQHMWQLQGPPLNINNMQDDEEAFQEDKLKEQEQPPEPNLKNEEKNPESQCQKTTRCSEEQGQQNQEQRDFDQHDEILIGEPQVVESPKSIRSCRRRLQKLRARRRRMRIRKNIQLQDLIVRTVRKPKGEGVKKVINHRINNKIIKNFNQSLKLKKKDCRAQILKGNRVSSKKINIRRLKHSPSIQMIQKIFLQIALIGGISNLLGNYQIYFKYQQIALQQQQNNIVENIHIQEQIQKNQIKVNQLHEVNEEIHFVEFVPNAKNNNKNSSKELIMIINHEESQIEEILYEDYQDVYQFEIYQLQSDPQNPNQYDFDEHGAYYEIFLASISLE